MTYVFNSCVLGTSVSGVSAGNDIGLLSMSLSPCSCNEFSLAVARKQDTRRIGRSSSSLTVCFLRRMTTDGSVIERSKETKKFNQLRFYECYDSVVGLVLYVNLQFNNFCFGCYIESHSNYIRNSELGFHSILNIYSDIQLYAVMIQY